MFTHDSLFLFGRTKRSLCFTSMNHKLTDERRENGPDKYTNYFVKEVLPVRFLILLN